MMLWSQASYRSAASMVAQTGFARAPGDSFMEGICLELVSKQTRGTGTHPTRGLRDSLAYTRAKLKISFGRVLKNCATMLRNNWNEMASDIP
jgi:hypothetical protein